MIDSSKTVEDEGGAIDETVAPSNTLSSFDIRRHDSQADLNKYVINYVDDAPTQSDLKALPREKSFGTANKHRSRLEVSQLPDEV